MLPRLRVFEITVTTQYLELVSDPCVGPGCGVSSEDEGARGQKAL